MRIQSGRPGRFLTKGTGILNWEGLKSRGSVCSTHRQDAKKPIDTRMVNLVLSPSFSKMSTSEETQPQSINPGEISFTTPQELKDYTTDTGKILPRKYTHLSAKHQRRITKTVKRARNLLFAQ